MWASREVSHVVASVYRLIFYVFNEKGSRILFSKTNKSYKSENTEVCVHVAVPWLAQGILFGVYVYLFIYLVMWWI